MQLVVRKRDRRQAFKEIWTLTVDPKDMYVDTSPPAPAGPVIGSCGAARPSASSTCSSSAKGTG